MGDHSSSIEAAATQISGTSSGIGEPFWENALHGKDHKLVDPVRSGKAADATAMLPWVDGDDHLAGASDSRFWGDELRQEEFQRRRKRDAEMDTLRSQHAKELEGIPDAFRIEEQVVGSTHRFVVARPRINNELTALVTPSIRAKEAGRMHDFTPRAPTATGFYTLARNKEQEIAIEFIPSDAGHVTADLVLEIRWTDGSVDTRTITLYASARHRTEIPEREVPVSWNDQFREAAEFGALPPTGRKTPPAPTAQELSQSTSQFHELLRDTGDIAKSISERQVDGVNNAAQDAAAYSRKPPDTSMFFDLMELAISMGIAGVAGSLAKSIGAQLAKTLNRTDKDPLIAGLADSVKEGFKRIGHSAAIRQTLPTPTEGNTEDTSKEPLSSNPQIAFFAEQVEALRDLADQNKALISEQAGKLMPLLATDPEQAVAVIRSLKQAFDEVGKHEATRIQARESAAQWVSAVARSSLGAETATTHDRSYQREVTALSKYGALADGVLTIQVERSGAEVHVLGATIRGVSQEIADRLSFTALKDVPIPIRLEIGGAVIHVDEAKRMRVYGTLDPNDPTIFSEYVRGQNMPEQIEAQTTARAEKLVSIVLSKALKAWGVRDIISDDATGRGVK